LSRDSNHGLSFNIQFGEIRTLVAWLKSTLFLKIECEKAEKHIFIWKQNVYKQSKPQHYFGLEGKALGAKRHKVGLN